MPFLDKDGLARLWNHILSKIRITVRQEIENIPTITPDIMMAIMDEVQLVCPIADVDNSILMIDDNTILIL
jgi:hypothetical protein